MVGGSTRVPLVREQVGEFFGRTPLTSIDPDQVVAIGAEQHAMDMAGKIQEITKKFGLGYIYKTSFDKANRTSLKGKRGAGLEASLPVFDKIKKEFNIPILTDIHSIDQCSEVADHVDILQIPAFLCRQTDLLIAPQKQTKLSMLKKDSS